MLTTSTVMPSNPVPSKLLGTVIEETARSARPERTQTQILEDIALMKAAKDIREWLVQISGLIPRLNQRPNPYYSGTIDGLTLICYYGGPSEVGTPYGGWAATGGGCLDNANWLAEATERLGLETLIPEFTNSNGVYGPVFRITKDLEGNTLPHTEYQALTAIANGSFLSANVMTAFTSPGTIRALCGKYDVSYESAEMQLIEGENRKTPAYEDLTYDLVIHAFKRVKHALNFVEWDDAK